MQALGSLRAFAVRLWRTDTPLMSFALAMLVALGLALAGLWADPRLITGAPAWLKPAKFALSTAMYAATLAWMFTFLPDWRRTRRMVSRTTVSVLTLEIAIIYAQAWRGTSSHFNVGTPLDAALFGVMGAAIVFQTIVAVAVAVALWRQAFADEALGWALRVGMALTLVGAASGGLMTRPSDAQLAEMRLRGRPAVVGAHTVGAPDGGPGLPLTGWSTGHGDLRVAHFLGLHAMQALPVLALLLGRRRIADQVRTRLVLTAAASYACLFAILVWLALRGIPLLGPDPAALVVLALWASGTAAGAARFVGRFSSLFAPGVTRCMTGAPLARLEATDTESRVAVLRDRRRPPVSRSGSRDAAVGGR